MTKPPHLHPSDLRAVGRLTIEAIVQVTRLVETLHHTITQMPAPLGTARGGATRGITGLVYRSIHGVTALVGGTLDVALARLPPLLLGNPALASSREREAVLAALNGILGDHLAASANPLAIPLRLRRDGEPLPLDATTAVGSKVMVLVHGLCMNDRQWARARVAGDESAVPDQYIDAAATLARELGYTPLHLHYNSGRHVSHNGRDFAQALQAMAAQWPQPLDELLIVGHSMGGLVARSACHHGAAAGHAWLRSLRAMVFLGTPHHGAPLERGGNGLDLLLGASPYTAPFARLGKIRSAGITDLRYGNLRDEDWSGRDRFAGSGDQRQPLALPADVRCYAIAASTGKPPGDPGERLPGDGLVPLDSALGRHPDAAMTLAIPEAQRWVGYGINHLELLHHPAVFAQLRRWLAAK